MDYDCLEAIACNLALQRMLHMFNLATPNFATLFRSLEKIRRNLRLLSPQVPTLVASTFNGKGKDLKYLVM